MADITTAQVLPVGPDAVRLEGARPSARPPTLKVNVCFESGWFAEGEISYAGPCAEARARLAGQVLRERLQGLGPVRVDLIGVTSVLGDDASTWLDAPAAGLDGPRCASARGACSTATTPAPSAWCAR